MQYRHVCTLETTPFLIHPVFLSNLNGALNPSILNWVEGYESSNFVSQIKRITPFLPIIIFQEPNLFLNELIFKWPNINLSGKQFFISFDLIFASMILLQEQYSHELLKYFPESLKLLQSYEGTFSLASVLWYTSKSTK